jgi:chemotaxis protein methyltransferase CheR
VNRISDLIPLVLHDSNLFKSLLFSISVTVTEMFRDPEVYQELRKHLVPYLKTYPYSKIWCAGCATGEEVYSLAILLKEAGLHKKVQIYATDINDESLEKAKLGIYSNNQIKEYTSNYRLAGGNQDFSSYYHSSYDSVIMDKSLRDNVVFANHNLVSDKVFGEMQLVICRNTLIYFDRVLQERVLNLFRDSLVHKGFLCLGTKESLQFSAINKEFKIISAKSKLFQLE